MVTVHFFAFAKRKNSTAIPEKNTSVRTVQCALKGSVSRGTPSLEIQGWTSANYCFIEEFARYYYIDNLEYEYNDVYIVRLREDTLGSFRSSILNSNQYVERSTKNYDVNIPDNFYPAKCTKQYKSASQAFVDSAVPGSYIIGIVGKGGGNSGSITGAVQYYMMSQNNVKALMDYLFSPENFVEEISDEVVKTFFNPFQYITKCMYYPFQTDTGGTEISLGWFNPGVEGRLLTGAHGVPFPEGIQIAIPRPQDNNADYRNYYPYCSYRIYIPYIGFIELDGELFRSDDHLTIRPVIDYPTGTMLVSITGTESARYITTVEGNACAEISIAQVSIGQDTFQLGATAVGGLTNALGNFIEFANDEPGRERQQAVGKYVSSVGNGIAGLAGQVSTKGQNGCISQRFFITDIVLIAEYHELVDYDLDRFGAPCCKEYTLSALFGGFVKCLNAQFQNSAAYLWELEEINDYLIGGIYLV